MTEQEFAMRLAQLREKKGISAREMSLAMGQNPGYINNIENGKSLPSLPGVFYICEYLGLREHEFFDLGSTNPSKLEPIIKDLKRLDDGQLEAIARLVKDLAKKRIKRRRESSCRRFLQRNDRQKGRWHGDSRDGGVVRVTTLHRLIANSNVYQLPQHRRGQRQAYAPHRPQQHTA